MVHLRFTASLSRPAFHKALYHGASTEQSWRVYIRAAASNPHQTVSAYCALGSCFLMVFTNSARAFKDGNSNTPVPSWAFTATRYFFGSLLVFTLHLPFHEAAGHIPAR